MLKDAVKEVRYHPGRVAATVIAIAISVAFLAGVSIYLRTQGVAEGKRQAIATSRADLVASVGTASQIEDPTAVTKAISEVQGVDVVEPIATESAVLSHGGTSVMATVYPLPNERFRWSRLTAGQWPTSRTQAVISQEAAKKLGVSIGQTFDRDDTKVTLVGTSDEPKSMTSQTMYVGAGAAAGQNVSEWDIALKPGTDRTTAMDAVRAALLKVPGASKDAKDGVKVVDSKTFQKDAVDNLIGQFDATKYMLMVFGGIALLVGVIIITTTFLILLAQRRRQIGLLRAVGASGGYVRRMVLSEAIVLGVIGSLLGIVVGAALATAGAWYTGALWFGLSWPWVDLLVEFGVGVLITVLAAFVPAIHATRVAPLEALRPVPTVEQRKKASLVRIISCSLVFAGGVVMAVLAFKAPTRQSVPWAMGGAALIAIAVLVAAPLYVPTLIRGIGLLVRPFGPTARLSTANAVRNPTRTSLTAVALMLAVGLSVTLQIGTATTRTTAMDLIDMYYPVDLQFTSQPTTFDRTTGKVVTNATPQLSREAVDAAEKLPNIKSRLTLPGTMVTTGDSSDSPVLALAASPEKMRAISTRTSEQMADGTVLVAESGPFRTGSKVTLTGSKGKVTLTAKVTKALHSFDVMVVTDATMSQLDTSPKPASIWMKMASRDNMATTLKAAVPLLSMKGTSMDGGFLFAAILDQILKTLLIATSALLGVAVLIALIGVANTLGLSVLERRRESALLRAMGMQRRDLRLMLLYESLQTGFVGLLVGVVGGAFFAWLGISSVFRTAKAPVEVHFAIDWGWTLGLVGVCLAAASLASVLPGRRAALAAPTEALADE
ncbi:ABC transporter permease [Acidipropionibacterium timonense]|uniref:ABC transporter permease n=1 Tax=Acidipropionibacterium timonense TaxID=2161818 RepID=UPI0010301C8D|nr:FtsX-like permease family protein [Acidipropionibacterium timonense]